MLDLNQIRSSRTVEWILRLSAAGCFVGHGAFGILKKPQWLPYFSVVHVSPYWADKFLPCIGLMDIVLGISVLWRPRRAVFLWMAFWAAWTALLRPLAGEGIWDFFDCTGNYGIPLAFLVYNRPDPFRSGRLILILKIATGLLLIGHGGFGAFQAKEILIRHYAAIGIFLTRPALAFIGWFEILLGMWALLKPLRMVLIFVFLWKIGTELLYPLSGAPVWEFVERFSSYGAPLALFFLLPPDPRKSARPEHDSCLY